jgi:deoxyribodipyrimidine photo-lyase
MPTPKTEAMRDDERPVIVWFRRDLRLADNPALHLAAASGRPVIALYVMDETAGVRRPGKAGLWWLDKSLRALEHALQEIGAELILRRGEAGTIVKTLAADFNAGAVFWNRLYDPVQVDRDKALKTALKNTGVQVKTCNAALLLEPWEIQTKTGGVYHVFTPFWRAARARIGEFAVYPPPKSLRAPKRQPSSDALANWGLHPEKPDWSKGFGDWTPGEAGAYGQLSQFIAGPLTDYPEHRDLPALNGTTRLSPHLHWGEIGPRQVFRAIDAAAHGRHNLDRQSEKVLSELGWREFNHHLLFEQPGLTTENFKPQFDTLPWREDKRAFSAWSQGLTGYPMVDAGMRELWTTGYMENRVRMVAASFLIKHLVIDWRKGEGWFWDTLCDADEANNVMNWQWVAGSGADASPWFRIFNPIAQGERYDPEGDYVRRWIPELAKLPAKHIHAPWTAPDALLKEAGVILGDTYPRPIVEHEVARKRALEVLKTTRAND